MNSCPPDAQTLLDNPLLLAQRAHRAEVTHFGAPGGTMDHVTSAVGGLLRVGPGPWEVTKLPSLEADDSCRWVLAYSGQPKDTWGQLHRCKDARLALYDKLKGNWDTSDKETIQTLTADEQVLLSATRVNRDTEREAAALWRSNIGGETNEMRMGEQLGHLMQRHHEALRDGLELSTDVLERLGQAARDAGAFGFKVVGSGGGGCGVAWTSSNNVAMVAKAMENAGAPQVWVIAAPGQGARLILPEQQP
jgi:galactokinase